MTYQETTTQSYASRLKNSFKGILFGIILFIVATGLLYKNEERAVKTKEAIVEVSKNAVILDDISTVSKEKNIAPVYATGMATTNDIVEDPIFHISENAIKLIREVEYYQFEETCETEEKENMGGSVTKTTTCTYDKGWSNEVVNSSKFKEAQYRDKNFILLDVKSNEARAKNVSFGAYKLPEFFIKQIVHDENFEIKINDDVAKLLQENIKDNYYTFHPEKKVLKRDAENNLKQIGDEDLKLFHIDSNVIYIGKNPMLPQIGDVKISFKKTTPTDISIIAKLSNDTFTKYLAKNGREFSKLEVGTVSFADMIEHAKTNNTILTWVLRLLGIILLYASFCLIFDIISMLFKWLPFLGFIVEIGTSIASILLSITWGLLVISISWLAYRPTISAVLIAIIFFLIIYFKKKSVAKEIVVVEK